MAQLQSKLAKLPKSPGVYFFKSSGGEIIYIGKAASLRGRVRQYWQASRARDPKTDMLVGEIKDVEWTAVETEVDALFLEAELVRRYLPRYNILLRDDKSLQYVRIDYKSDYPTVKVVRRPLDDGAEYFGPYVNGFGLKKALRYLRRAFPYATAKPLNQKRPSLHYHLGLDPGLESGQTSLADYRANLRQLMQYLKGHRVALTRAIEKDMKRAARARDFEAAAKFRNQLYALQALSRQVIFSDREIQQAASDQALVELAQLLGLAEPPKRVEGFDISHIQGTDTTASMVVFVSGLPYKAAYRKFKMRLPGNDDYAHMAETVSRRFSQANRKKWGLPDLALIDGGKGQLSAALAWRDQAGLSIPMIGLAKKDEAIIISKSNSLPAFNAEEFMARAARSGAYVNDSAGYLAVRLPENSNIVKLLQRVRDESHRFAISYHSALSRRRQTSSLLDGIPGVGPATRKRLIRAFGSAKGVLAASPEQLQELLGEQRGADLARQLQALRPPSS